jgi:hypothetical protein
MRRVFRLGIQKIPSLEGRNAAIPIPKLRTQMDSSKSRGVKTGDP